MKKFLFILFTIPFILSGCGNTNENNTTSNYNASRTQLINNIDNEESFSKPKQPVETDISSFSTKIYTPNDKKRLTNIGITCSKLNETVVKPR